MKKKYLRLFIVLTIAVTLGFEAEVSGLKVASYNIRNGIGMDDRQDLSRLAETVRRLEADFVGVQEVDSMTRRSGSRYILGEIADATGMIPVYAPAIDYDGGRYGIGLLCRTAPDSIVRLSLPGSEEARTALICLWPDVAVCCTHLSLTEDDALEGAVMAARQLQSMAGNRTIVFLGDFNTLPDSPLWEMLASECGLHRIAGFGQPTFPSDHPSETIDYIISNRPETFEAIEVIDSQASDHRPITTNLTIR